MSLMIPHSQQQQKNGLGGSPVSIVVVRLNPVVLAQVIQHLQARTIAARVKSGAYLTVWKSVTCADLEIVSPC
jgi:hypothetical protein